MTSMKFVTTWIVEEKQLNESSSLALHLVHSSTYTHMGRHYRTSMVSGGARRPGTQVPAGQLA